MFNISVYRPASAIIDNGTNLKPPISHHRYFFDLRTIAFELGREDRESGGGAGRSDGVDATFCRTAAAAGLAGVV